MPPQTWRRSNHAGVVLPRVEANDGVEGTKLEATVRDDFSEGHAETSVEGKKLLGPAAVFSRQTNKPSKVSSRANIRSKARSSVVQRIHDRKTPCCRKTTRRHVHSEEHAEILLRAVIRERKLDRILEGQIEGLRRKKQPDAIREVDSPEGRGDLLAVNAKEKFPDAGVARHLSVPDLWNGILGLKRKPDALDGRGERLRNVTRDSSEEEIGAKSLKDNSC